LHSATNSLRNEKKKHPNTNILPELLYLGFACSMLRKKFEKTSSQMVVKNGDTSPWDPNPLKKQRNPSYPSRNPSYPSANPSYPSRNPSYPSRNPGYPSAFCLVLSEEVLGRSLLPRPSQRKKRRISTGPRIKG